MKVSHKWAECIAVVALLAFALMTGAWVESADEDGE